jgi:general secretion pathway protein A
MSKSKLSGYYGFQEEPFGASRDARCLYPSSTHREALASLKYGFSSNRGFTALIAKPGLGKTTLLFRFLEDIRESARTVFLFNVDPQCEAREIISYILRDLGIVPGRDSAEMHEQLNNVVLAEARAGRRFVVVIDEAQNLSEASLEMVRMLTNFETSRSKLMQVVLAGQPELFDKLVQPSMAQLRQRISTFCRIEALSPEQTRGYIEHHLKFAGYRGAPLFTAGALNRIVDAGQGVPRIINNLCFNTLSLCCALKRKQVDEAMVAEVIADQQWAPDGIDTPAVQPQAVQPVAVQPLVAQPHLAQPQPTPVRFDGAKRLSQKPGLIRTMAFSTAALLVASVVAVLARSEPQVLKPFQSGFENARETLGPPVPVFAAAPEDNNKRIFAQPAPPKTASFAITVKPNEKLGDLALEYLGVYNENSLREIQELNPQLIDPDHIEVGQTIYFPAR